MSESSRQKTFCVLPWIHSFVNYNGGYQVCCTSEEYLLSLLNDKGEPLKIQDRPSMEAVMNSGQMKKLRQDMLLGVKNPICTRCYMAEDLGGVSRRQMENDHYKKHISSLVGKTSDDGSIPIHFKNIDYRLGNLCNLKCRMCSPQSSTLWNEEWNRVKPANEHLSTEKLLEYKNYHWIKDEGLRAEFKEKLGDIDRLHFAGGEPLIVPELIELLEICVLSGTSKNIVLSFNTNLTRIPERILEQWKHFKEVKLLCSIDGFGKLNEYIRHPSRWDIVDRHLKFLDENAQTYHLSEILLSTTVQIFNVLELDQLYSYLKSFKNIVPALNLINLHEPVYFQTSVLPSKIKQMAAERLKNVAQELDTQLQPQHRYLKDNIFQVINFMNGEDRSNLLPLFRKTNALIDKERGLSMHHFVPELNTLLSKHYLAEL